MDRKEAILTLAKSLLATAEQLEKNDITQLPHYQHFMAGALFMGATHEQAHQGAIAHHHKLSDSQMATPAVEAAPHGAHDAHLATGAPKAAVPAPRDAQPKPHAAYQRPAVVGD